MTGLFGFIFWSFAARTYPSSDVGLATTIISVLSLLANLSLLGFNISLLRFHKKDNGKLHFSALSLCSLASLVLAALFLLFVGVFSPSLVMLKENAWYAGAFILFTVLHSMSMLCTSVFIAEEQGFLILMKETLFSTAKVALMLLVSGIVGLVISWNVGILLGVLFSLCFVKMHNVFDFRQLGRMLSFTFYNYLGHIFAIFPGMLLPIIITGFLSPSDTAYFYLSWMTANGLFIIATASSSTFLSEASKSRKPWRKQLWRAIFFTSVLLGLGIGLVLFFGPMVFSFFGNEYLTAVPLLNILALSSIPYSFRVLCLSLLNLRNKARGVAASNFFVLFVTVLGSLLFLQYGVVMVGVSWLVGNALGLLFTAFLL